MVCRGGDGHDLLTHTGTVCSTDAAWTVATSGAITTSVVVVEDLPAEDLHPEEQYCTACQHRMGHGPRASLLVAIRDHENTAFQQPQMLFCVSQARVSTEMPTYSCAVTYVLQLALTLPAGPKS